MAQYDSFGDYRFTERDSNVATIVSALAVGLGIGALIALVMAPKTGKQMRKTLRRKYEDARDTVGDWSEQASDVWDRRGDFADAAKRRVAPIARKFRTE